MDVWLGRHITARSLRCSYELRLLGVAGGGIKAREEEKNNKQKKTQKKTADRKGELPRKKTQNLTGRLHFSAAARPVYGCLASTGGSSLTTCVGEGWRLIAHKGKKEKRKKKGGGVQAG